MNPLVVWLPTIAAAALLSTAVVVMTSDAAAAAAPAAPAPAAQDDTADDLEPTAEELAPTAEETRAVQDSDGSEMLAVMEQQLENARRILSTMRNSPPTHKALKHVHKLRRRGENDLRALKDMGAARVPADVFHRAEAVARELKETEAAAAGLLKDRRASPGLPGQGPDRWRQDRRANPGQGPDRQDRWRQDRQDRRPPQYESPAPQAADEPQYEPEPAPQVAYEPQVGYEQDPGEQYDE